MSSHIEEALADYIKLLKDRINGLELMLAAPPVTMTTPLGMLPINSDGMRQLVDALNKKLREPTVEAG